jgi:hypothetical protein
MGTAISGLVFQPPEVTYMHAKKHIIWLKTKNDANVPAFYIDRRSQITGNLVADRSPAQISLCCESMKALSVAYFLYFSIAKPVLMS